MIKINLLKSYATQGNANAGASASYFSDDGDERKTILINFAKRVAILLIGPLALHIYESQVIPELNNQLTIARQTVAEARSFNESKRGLTDEIKKYEQEQSKISAQMSFIDQVSKDKLNEYKLFRQLQNVMPETIWLNRLEFAGSDVTLIAETDVPGDISKFMERITNTDFLINVSPIKQDVKIDGYGIGLTTTVFSVKAHFNSERSPE